MCNAIPPVIDYYQLVNVNVQKAVLIMSEKSDVGVKIDETINSILNDTKDQPDEFRYAVRAHKTLTSEATTDRIGDDITVCHASYGTHTIQMCA